MSSNLYGPPTFADHLGGLIAEIDEVQKRVRDQQEEEILRSIQSESNTCTFSQPLISTCVLLPPTLTSPP